VRPVISCQTLGPVGLSVDGGPAPPELLWRKHLALLIYLARSPRGRSREHLVGLLWAEKPETAARHSLNEAVRVLRRHLGEEAVDTSGGQVRLATGAIRLDVERFEALANAGDWGTAVPIIAGEFLEGFAIPGASAFEDWLAGERSTLRHRSVEVLARHAEELLRAGRTSEAVMLAQRALTLDPRSEPALRLAMKSLVLAGDRTGALDRYDTFCARLGQEVGTLPSAETQALVERVRQERAIRPALLPRAERRGDGAAFRLPLIGRETELAKLVDAATGAVRERRSAVLLVEGDSGTGKTRLSEELLARLRLDGVIVSSARAVEADRTEEWSGILALARSGLLQARGLVATPASALMPFTRVLPEWADRFPALPRDGAPMSPGRALSEVLRAATEEQPVALAVDDAYWLDDSSLLALQAVLRDLASAPLLLILTDEGHSHRPELDEVRTRLGREFHGVTVRLSSLDAAALRALARHMLPTFNDVEIERVVRRVAIDSAGLPLLAVELFRAVALGLDLRGTPGAWPEPFKTLDQTLPGDLPETVVAAIRIGFRRLTPVAQRVLSHAAVIGDRVPRDLLGRVAGVPEAELLPALDELEWHRWLVCESRGYSFVARVVRQVIGRDMLTPGQRQRALEAAGTV
jgi:DNA-binding SARP family transcriptional activator